MRIIGPRSLKSVGAESGKERKIGSPIVKKNIIISFLEIKAILQI